MPIPQGKKRKKKKVKEREIKVEEIQGKNRMGSKGLHRGEVQRKNKLQLGE
jgi:hypothetical protein